MVASVGVCGGGTGDNQFYELRVEFSWMLNCKASYKHWSGIVSSFLGFLEFLLKIGLFCE